MRLRTFGLATVVMLGAGLVQTSEALVRPKGADAPHVASRAGRDHRALAYNQSSKLAAAGLTSWKAVFDQDTGVPVRLWGSTAPIAGSSTNAATAEAAARAFLASHLELLAPGATTADLVLLANQVGVDGIRTVSFEQHVNGMRVLGAAVNFAFKRDHLVMVGSTAMPHVATNLAMPQRAIAPAILAGRAQRWLAESGYLVAVPASLVSTPTERVIVPTVRTRSATALDITYQVADQLSVSATNSPGRWNVWLDSSDGSPIARTSTISWVSNTGTVNFDVPDQWPGGTRTPRPAAFATHLVNGTMATATIGGVVTWDGAATATLVPRLNGSRVAITNVSGSLVTGSLQLTNGQAVTWSQAATPMADAQLDAFVYANTAKEFVKTKLNPNLTWLDGVVSVSVNETMTCNAYSTGDDIHFFVADTMCENTGRLADVVYHESGHSVHFNSIIPGAGAFDGSLSEGLADTLGVSITGDHGLGRGFEFNDKPLRDVASMPSISDPAGRVKRWPADADGEVHNEGEIIGEALWDTRTALIAKLGQEAGYAKTLQIYYNIMQRSVDIPSSTFVEALVADDDDGDLTNGTPNQCLLTTAFGKHGLADPTMTLGLGTPTRDQFNVTLPFTPSAATDCGGPTISGTSVDWRLRGGAGGTIDLALAGSTYTGAIPTQGDGAVVEYRVQVKLSDGTTISYPNNPADPYYQFYVGTPTTLWCSNFETGASDWTHGATPTNRDEWQVGMPMGLGGDPKTAFDGTAVFGTDLTTDGQYRGNGLSWAETPSIDLMGNKANVHLQYERWLGVEDGFYDQATIAANGELIWSNFKSATDPMTAEVNHVDKEWRFQDVDVSSQAASSPDGKLKLHFELNADQGLSFGGWTLDNVCIVLAKPAPDATCGDGVVSGSETCDDGNGVDGDGCSAACQLEDGSGGGKADGGCCSSSTNPAGPLSFGALALGLVLRRRRRVA